LAEQLRSVLAHPAGLSQRAAAARQAGPRDAAQRLADLVGELAPADGIGPAKVAA
jgi:UDP-N-acetylglucosamine:LPS N-acetylglucosamine transferase